MTSASTPPAEPTTRSEAFLDSIVAGLITNAITALLITVVAVAGGYVAVAKGLAVVTLGAMALASGAFAFELSNSRNTVAVFPMWLYERQQKDMTIAFAITAAVLFGLTIVAAVLLF